MKIEELRKKAMALPEQPGVYLMKNAAGEIIYIGKAKVLKNRVSQYFGSQNNHTRKVRRMVQNVSDFDYVIVGSEFEALVLECSLIKQHMPKYNILLRDDKGYHYIKVTNDSWKMLYDVKQKADDGAKYYGPYTSSDAVGNAVRQALDIFMLPHCQKQFPRDASRHARPCLNYYIKLCAGACCKGVTREDHNASVEDAVQFVLGGKNMMLRTLRAEMNEASEALDYERAAKLRDRIRAIERVSQRQYMVATKYKNQDVFGVASMNTRSAVCVLRFREGDLIDTQTTVVERIENPAEEYAEMLASFYQADSDWPDRITLDTQPEQSLFLEQSFSEMAGKKVTLYVPKAGESKTLLAVAGKNASEKLARVLSSNNKNSAALYELQEALGLERLPLYIEAYDISNTAGQENVCGMVVFRNGRPLKRCYKRFQIRSFEGQDDYRSLAEVMERRIREYREIPEKTEEGFGRKPDLILLDGGIGQVNAVKPILERYNFDVPLFGMVKDGKHRTRAIAYGGGEISIQDKRSVFTLIAEIQEEVHRFAIGYHKTLKKKHTLINSLTGIPGIGEKRAKLLLERFLTLDALRQAQPDELASVSGMTAQAAQNVYAFFHGDESMS
ncbi:MAG: excinuclease ABC subunit UvrC [Clostridia bacterium]|nr:excinuclease ABC subunit UvrC [Clostridia bacterium]